MTGAGLGALVLFLSILAAALWFGVGALAVWILSVFGLVSFSWLKAAAAGAGLWLIKSLIS